MLLLPLIQVKMSAVKKPVITGCIIQFSVKTSEEINFEGAGQSLQMWSSVSPVFPVYYYFQFYYYIVPPPLAVRGGTMLPHSSPLPPCGRSGGWWTGGAAGRHEATQRVCTAAGSRTTTCRSLDSWAFSTSIWKWVKIWHTVNMFTDL